MTNKIKILFFIIFFAVEGISYAQTYNQHLLPASYQNAEQIVEYIDNNINNTSLTRSNLFVLIHDEIAKATLRNDSFQMSLSYFYLAKLYGLDWNYHETIKNYKKAIHLVNVKKYPGLTGVFYNRIGIAHEKLYEFDTALFYYLKSLQIREKIKDTSGIVISLNFIGKIYKQLGKYDLAFDYFTKALNTISDTVNLEMSAFTYINLALIFSEIADYDYAEKYLKQALSLREKLGNEKYIANTYLRLAELFVKKNKYDDAIEYSLKAIALYDKNRLNKNLPAVYNLLGMCYLYKKEYSKAHSFFNNAHHLAIQFSNKIALAKNALYFGKLYAIYKDYSLAIKYFQEAIEKSEKLQMKAILTEAYKQIALAHFVRQNYKEAYLSKEQYEKLYNEIYSADFAKIVADFTDKQKLEKLSLIYQFKQKEEEIKQNAKMHRAVLLRNIFIFISLFFILFALLLFYHIKQKSKINTDLINSKKLVDEKQKQIVKQRDTLIRQKKELTDILNNIIILKKAIEQSSSTIVITDIDGNIEYVNPKFEKLTGYTFEEVKGKNPRILKSGNNNESFYKELWDTILSGNEWRGEFINKRKNGEIFTEYASISSVKNENGKIVNFIAVKDDVTEQQKVLSELEKLTAVQTKVFSIIGHDLRSPIGSIKSILELLTEKEYVKENTEFSRILKMILQSITSIVFLSENLLDWGVNWLKGKDPVPRDFIINDLINENIAVLQTAAERKKIKLSSKIVNSINIFADPEMISIVIRNLIANAIKFTPQHGTISIQGQKLSKDKVEISITDNGVGIKKELIPVLLDEFNLYTAAGTESEKGSGLGLSICLQFIKQNKGKLFIDSTLGKGSVFKFILPAYSNNKAKPEYYE